MRSAWFGVGALVGVLGGCRPSVKTIETESGTFRVPGPARVKGGPDRVHFVTLENRCEFVSSGQTIELLGVKEKDGRTLFRVDRIGNCPGSWLEASHLEEVTP